MINLDVLQLGEFALSRPWNSEEDGSHANSTDDELVDFDGDRSRDNGVDNGHERRRSRRGITTHSPYRPLFYVVRAPRRDKLGRVC